jgi:hypothetical protein
MEWLRSLPPGDKPTQLDVKERYRQRARMLPAARLTGPGARLD